MRATGTVTALNDGETWELRERRGIHSIDPAFREKMGKKAAHPTTHSACLSRHAKLCHHAVGLPRRTQDDLSSSDASVVLLSAGMSQLDRNPEPLAYEPRSSSLQVRKRCFLAIYI